MLSRRSGAGWLIAVSCVIASCVQQAAIAETLAEKLQRMGDYHYSGQEYEEAESYYEQALKHRRGDRPSRKIINDLLFPLRTCCEKQGKYDEAIEYNEMVVSMMQALPDTKPESLVVQRVVIGRLHKEAGDRAEAEQALKTAVAMARKISAENSVLAEALAVTAELELAAGKEIQAQQTAEEAVRIAEAALDHAATKDDKTIAKWTLERTLADCMKVCSKVEGQTQVAAWEARLKELKAEK
jgi:tetratricopeptide (TPR) repeat protein